MATYSYYCQCGFEETIKEKMGAPREHPCIKCGGTCKRAYKKTAESTMETTTPGAAVQKHKEHRCANEVMSKIRNKLKLPANTNKDALAADRHWGRKNKLIPGN